MKKNMFKLAAILLSVIMALCVYYLWEKRDIRETEKLIKVNFDSVPAIVEALSHVAYDNKYFEKEGLDIRLKINPDGKTSLENLFAGKTDIAHVMGTPVVYSSFDRNDFYIIGNIKHSKIHFIVARKDRGIASPSDLKGKKIAVMRGTSAEFFMDSYLIFNGLKPSDMEIVNMNAPSMVAAIEKGDVDAMICWSPFPLIAKRKLGENAAVLPSGYITPGSWVIVVMKEYAHKNPETLKKFLSAIVRAENFVKENRGEAIRIHSKIAGVNQDIVAELFENMTLELTMEQSLLTNLEDQARWAIRYRYTDKTEVPNYLDLIYTDAIEAVKPDAFSIIK